MSGVDNKIVKMTFDNSSFQKNVSQTMSSLDALKKSLDFKGAGEGLKNIGAAAGKVDLSPIHTSIDGVNSGFLAMATVAATAISSITAKAAAAGGQIVKSLALDPVMDGFKEYEVNMDSIQTILANTQSKGTTLDDVNGALDEMNTYSDKTIYNFSQMAKNVSKFTAAGIDLDTSVSSIKGLANVSALMGVKNEEAQRSMFQLSQAMGSGVVKLKDWISVENAGLSGEAFNNALVQTGQALGELTKMPVGSTFKDWTDQNGSFRDSLESGWLTTEVLTTTLGALAGDLDAVQLSDMGFSDEQVTQMVALGETALASATDVKTATQLYQTLKETMGSGWAKTFQTVIGNFTEAKGLFTNLNNFFGGFMQRSSDARNNLLAEWKWFGGRTVLFEGFTRGLNAIQIVLGAIGSAFREAFPKKTSLDLYNITVAFRDFAKKMTLNEEGLKRVKQIFGAVFSVMSIGVAIVKGLFSVFGALVGVFFDVIGGFGGAAGSAGDFISKIRELLVDKGGIAAFFKIITDNINRFGEAILWVRDKLGGIFDFAKEKGAEQFKGTLDTIKKSFGELSDFAEQVGDKIPAALQVVKNIFGELGDAWNGLVSIITQGDFIGFGKFFDFQEDSKVVDFLFDVREAIVNFYRTITGFDVGGTFDGVLSEVGGFFEGLWAKISGWETFSQALDDIRTTITNFFTGLFDATKGAGSSAGTTFSSIVDGIRSFAANLWDTVMNGLGPIGEGISNFFTNMFSGIKNAGGGLSDAVSGLMDKIKGAFKDDNFNKIMAALGAGIGISLTKSLSRLSKDGLKFDFGLEGAAEKFVSALDNLQGAIKSFQNNIRADTLLKIAIAMAVLAASIVALTFVDAEKIGVAMGALAAGVATLVGAMALLSKMSAGGVKFAGIGIGIMAVAAAVLILAAAVLVFGNMDPDVLKQGLISVSVALLALGAAAALMSKNSGGFIRAAISIGILGVSLIVLAQAIKYFAGMDIGTLLKGGYIITGILISLALLSNIVDGTAMQKFSIGLGLVSLSLWGLSKVIERFAAIPFWAMVQGLIGMAAVLAMVIITLRSMPDEKKSKASTLALLGMSAALWIMSKAVETVGKMGVAGLIAGVLSLVLVMGLLVVAALLMEEAQPGAWAMLTLAAALAVMAGSIYILGQLDLKQVGIALAAVAGVFIIFGIAGALLGPVIPVLLLFGAAMLMIGGGVLLFGAGLAFIGLGLLNLSKISADAIPKISKVIQAFVKEIPLIAKALAEAFVDIIRVIGKSAGDIADAIGDLLIALLEKLNEIIPVLGELIGTLIETLLTLLEEKVPRIIEVGLLLLTSFLTGIRDNMELIITLGLDILANFIQGLANGIPLIGEAVRNLIGALVNEVVLNIQLIINAGVSILVALLNGIANAIPQIVTAVGNVITAFITAIGGEMTRIINMGVITLLSFLWGITNNLTLIAGEMQKMFDALLDTIETVLLGDGKGSGGVIDKGIAFVKRFLSAMVDKTIDFANYMGDLVVALLNGLSEAVETHSKDIRTAAGRLAIAIINGITGGLWDNIKKVKDAALDVAKSAVEAVGLGWLVKSPSKVFYKLAQYAGAGIVKGFVDSEAPVGASAATLATKTVKSFNAAMVGIDFSVMDEFNPTITPVLDLTRVGQDAKGLQGLLGGSSVDASLSASQARYLSAAQRKAPEPDAPVAAGNGGTQVVFNQTINAPTALGANDIYRNTKSQLAMAKEELKL